MTPIAFVVAVAENGVIGRAGGLPWRVRADLKRFRAVTMNKPLVMGRRTFESIGRPLDGRTNIVISRDPSFAAEGIVGADSIEAALALAEADARRRGATEICVIGGGQIFAALHDRADRLYLTRIHASPEGDTLFPLPPPGNWKEISRQDLPPAEGDTAAAEFIVYERQR